MPGLPVHHKPRSLPRLMSIELVMPSNHLILCRPLSCHLQTFPASGSFQMSQLFTSGSQSISDSVSSNCLKLCFGTQGRSWRLESGYKKQGTETNLLTNQKETQTYEMNLWLPGEGIVRDFAKVVYTLLYLKWRSNQDLL